MPVNGTCFHNGVSQKMWTPCAVRLSVLSFLQYLFEKQRSAAATIKVFAAAISSCHEGFGRDTVFNHPLVRRFLLGMRRPRPRTNLPEWDLALVVDTLCDSSFEPLNQILLKMSSLKMLLLLAQTTAKRVSDLCALSTRPDCLAINGDLSRACYVLTRLLCLRLIRVHTDRRALGFFSPSPWGEERGKAALPVPSTRFGVLRGVYSID